MKIFWADHFLKQNYVIPVVRVSIGKANKRNGMWKHIQVSLVVKVYWALKKAY